VASLIQLLQGDDTLLLMYVVGELPDVDRIEVERRLAADAKLRADLERLSEAYGSFTSGMDAMDAASAVHADVSAAVRRASTAIRQWQARPAQAVAYSAERRPSGRWRVWAIPAAAAAIVLVVVGVSLYYNSTPSSPYVQGPRFPSSRPVVPPPVSPPAVQSDPAAVANLLAMTTPTASNAGIDSIADVSRPGLDPEAARDDNEGKFSHGEPGDGALFPDIPLDSGK
jgi:hypothetical protein